MNLGFEGTSGTSLLPVELCSVDKGRFGESLRVMTPELMIG